MIGEFESLLKKIDQTRQTKSKNGSGRLKSVQIQKNIEELFLSQNNQENTKQSDKLKEKTQVFGN